MRVLGIDPGLALTGYGCVEERGQGCAPPALVEAGCFRFQPRRSVSRRLVELERDLCELIERVRPGAVCVESLFAHYAHPRTAITMAHARGVILLVAQRAGAEVLELPPAEVKKAITGNGRATKEQMQRAVAAQMGFAEPPDPPDVADAIAVAVCALRRLALRAAQGT